MALFSIIWKKFMKHSENKMALFSIIWKKLAKSHIYRFVMELMESMMLKCICRATTVLGRPERH